MGFGSAELPHIEGVFREICDIEANDGVTFQADTVHAAEIRKEANYAGVRVMLLGVIDGARCQIQIDIGFGDAVTPGPDDVAYPVMLSEFAAPKLRVYPRYTVVAEKFEAMSTLGIANSRMKGRCRCGSGRWGRQSRGLRPRRDQTSMAVVFQTSCARAMSSPWRFSMDAAFHAGKAASLALIREIDVFCPTSVSATKLRVR